jgi:hypothetical protein
MSFGRLDLCFWQFWLIKVTTSNEWMWSYRSPNWARFDSNERYASSLPTAGGFRWCWRHNYSYKASKLDNPVSSDSFGWSSWQFQTNKCEATNLQIEQLWIQMKGVHPVYIYQLQVVLSDNDIRIALTKL